VVLDAGRVRAVGTHAELLGADPLYAELAAPNSWSQPTEHRRGLLCMVGWSCPRRTESCGSTRWTTPARLRSVADRHHR
jgi:hypothetical protein